MSFSATGRAALARVKVVVMRPCSNRFVTRLRNVARRCHGLRSSFEPDVRCRISVFSVSSLQGERRSGKSKFPLPLTLLGTPNRLGFGALRGPRPPHFKLLQAEVFFGGWRCRLARKRRPDDAAVLIELHAQCEAHLYENFLDLIEGLAAKVFGLEHFIFALLHQFANGL